MCRMISRMVANNPSLERMSFSFSRPLSYDILDGLEDNANSTLRSLRSIHLVNVGRLLANRWKYLTNLEELSVEGTGARGKTLVENGFWSAIQGNTSRLRSVIADDPDNVYDLLQYLASRDGGVQSVSLLLPSGLTGVGHLIHAVPRFGNGLVQFHIRTSPYNISSGLTLKDLMVICKHCPHLQELSYPMEGETAPSFFSVRYRLLC